MPPLSKALRRCQTACARVSRPTSPASTVRDWWSSFVDNPALIGGMRIRIGSDVYDGSVRSRLAALEARL